MAMTEFTKVAKLLPITIECNQIGRITLEECETPHKFAKLNSERLASLLHVLRESHQQIDGGFMTDMLSLANDLAYQVQQAVELMSPKAAVEVAHV